MLVPSPFSTRARKMLTSGLFLLVFGSCFSILLTLAYASLGPKPQDDFLTLSTLGSDMSAAKYYPGEGSFVSDGDTLNWNVRVYNHMGEPEYVAIRLKLLNETQLGPDDELRLPSPSDPIYEERRIVGNEDTLTMPLAITIEDVATSSTSSVIRTVLVNGKAVTNLNVGNEQSSDFRFIVELWRYDITAENFVFTWPSGPDTGSAWNQIRIQLR
ncbi:MAG: hypothetical protein ACRD5H_18330 [Nitrososphaerales archaeon]